MTIEDVISNILERNDQRRKERETMMEAFKSEPIQPNPLTNNDVVLKLSQGLMNKAPGSTSFGNTKSSGSVETWLEEGARLAGITLDPVRKSAMLKLIQRESSGNPRAVNNWDSNAKRGTPSKGILQTIQPTFDRYKVEGHNDIFNPVDNIAAALRYINSRYGDIMKVPSVITGKGGY